MSRNRVHPEQRSTGFTLIELMVSIVIGMITIAAAIALYIVIFKGSIDAIRSSRLNYDMESLLLLMVNDIRRAGYWSDAVSGSQPKDNPFTQPNSDIYINIDEDSDCIVYAYDANDSGEWDVDANGSADSDETGDLSGFRLNDDQSISIRVSGTTPQSCDDTGADWQPITVTDNNESVRITELVFSSEAIAATPPFPAQDATSYCINITVDSDVPLENWTCGTPSPNDVLTIRRLVNIKLTGVTGNNDEISKTLFATVRLGNDSLKLVP